MESTDLATRTDSEKPGMNLASFPDRERKDWVAKAFGIIGFQAKLLMVFVALFAVVMSLLVYMHYQSERVLLRKSVGNLRDMVNLVHYSTQSLSTQRPLSREEVDRFLKEVSTRNGVYEASVVDFDHRVVASSDSAKVGSLAEISDDSIGVWALADDSDGQPDKMRYQVRIPLVRHKQVEGIVQISMLLNDLSAYLWRLGQEQVLVFLLAVMAAFSAFYFILSRLHRPFRQMAAAAKKVANGDFNVQLEARCKGEEAEMAASFNHMARKLLEQRQMEERVKSLERQALLTELGASLAHEIRNPLNLMNLTLHHMGRSYRPGEADKQEPYQKMIASLKSEIQHLNGIVTEFLNLGKPSRIARRRFGLHKLVADVSVRLNPQLSLKGLRLEVDCPERLELNADQEQMRLVVLNLLLNCIEIVPPDTAITFAAKAAEETGAIVCTVTDQGPGIEPDDLDRIFEPYFSKRAGGVGLGLALVRRIVEEHGGEVRARNRGGGGAEFRFTVPLEI
jgi:signal transduction histidine kinase